MQWTKLKIKLSFLVPVTPLMSISFYFHYEAQIRKTHSFGNRNTKETGKTKIKKKNRPAKFENILQSIDKRVKR